MRVIAIMLVQDEDDIIEPVLIDSLNYFDNIYIYDTGSVDETLSIIEKMSSKEKKIELIFSKSIVFHESKTRRHALSIVKNKVQSGDWIVWLDSDEFIGLDPEAFRSFLENNNSKLIRHRHYNFGFTLDQLESNKEYFKYRNEFNKSFYNFFYEYSYTEVKCIKWESDLFNKMLGGRDFFLAHDFSKKRLPILHYPYRSLFQISKRLILRNMVMDKNSQEKFNKHWRAENFKDFIISKEKINVRSIKTVTLKNDFNRKDGWYDSRFTNYKRISIDFKYYLFHFLPFLHEFLIKYKSKKALQSITEFEPILKTQDFDNVLKESYSIIDVDKMYEILLNK
jgi:hypothetical protein